MSTPPIRPLLLDLFCGAGGAAKGYHDAGFEIVGIDNRPQPNYPFPFIQMDALAAMDRLLAGEGLLASDGRTYYLSDFDVIHASPPCQRFTNHAKQNRTADTHPDLVTPMRKRLQSWGSSNWIIENVPGAPLDAPIMLCGSSFSLRVRRHRLFESPLQIEFLPCDHGWQNRDKCFSVYQHGKWRTTGVAYVYGIPSGKAEEHWNEAMGIDWMTQVEIVEAVPPAFMEYIGRQLIEERPRNPLTYEERKR